MIDKERFALVLLQERKIYLNKRIDSDQVDKIAEMILWLDSQDINKEITLYINSRGGNVEYGFDLYDIIRHVKSPITGIVFKEAFSMAILVLQACKRRIIMEHAILGFHELDINLGCGWNKFEQESKIRVEIAEQEQKEYNRIIAERARLNVEEIRKLCEENKILSADEAYNMRLVDVVC